MFQKRYYMSFNAKGVQNCFGLNFSFTSPHGLQGSWGWPRRHIFTLNKYQVTFISDILWYNSRNWKFKSVTQSKVDGRWTERLYFRLACNKPLYFSIELGLTNFCSLLMLKTNKQEKMTRACYLTFPILHFYGINGL